jgi:hypothetical protein
VLAVAAEQRLEGLVEQRLTVGREYSRHGHPLTFLR